MVGKVSSIKEHIFCVRRCFQTQTIKRHKENNLAVLSPRSGPFQKLGLNVSSGGVNLGTYHPNALA
jgi:hypothetical protein